MLIGILFYFFLFGSKAYGTTTYSCFASPKVCNPITEHCIYGQCVARNELLQNDMKVSSEASNHHHKNFYDATDENRQLPLDQQRRIASTVHKVKSYLHSKNIELSDLRADELDQLAKALAEFIFQKEKEKSFQRVKLEALLREAGRSDLIRLVALDKISELEKLLSSQTDPSINITSNHPVNSSRQVDVNQYFQTETPSRKPNGVSSPVEVPIKVEAVLDNQTYLIKSADNQSNSDPTKLNSFGVQSRDDQDPPQDIDNDFLQKLTDATERDELRKRSGSKVEKDVAANDTTRKTPSKEATYIIVIVVLIVVVLCIIAIALVLYCMKSNETRAKLLGMSASESGDDYEDLCRQHYASKTGEKTDPKQPFIPKAATSTRRLYSPSGVGKSSRNSSQSSWSEEPITTTLDISTGHAVLAYMEDHLNNKDRLDQEWIDLCAYKVEGVSTQVARDNSIKNRNQMAVPYDHNRVMLKIPTNSIENDYINASYIIDNDPRLPVYIATQGPLSSTIHHFWQMVWDQGCVVIVMLTPLIEEGVSQCSRYWPCEGSSTYNDFEIYLVSEHIWCEDYLVRSLYLKHLISGETRTVTQFHFLSWPSDGVPTSSKQLLELRRKVSKCYRANALSPIVVHCSDGCGRTGSYMLLDMAITRMVKGTSKEIDIAATLEHLRDQRAGPMVSTKGQLEFALACVADEVNAILKVLRQ